MISKRQEEANKVGLLIECICPNCFATMKPIYENNGFNAPDPEKVELTGYKCPICGGNY